MKDFDFESFFRYLAPGAFTVVVWRILWLYHFNESYIEFIPKDMGTGASIVSVAGMALLGQVLSVLYHSFVNFFGLRISHRDFIKSLETQKMINFQSYDQKYGNGISAISQRGSWTILDSEFFRMRRNTISDVVEKRYESLFHVYHGIGTALFGLGISVFAFVLWAERTSGLHWPQLSAVRIIYFLVLILLFLGYLYGWYNLRQTCEAHIESSFMGTLTNLEKAVPAPQSRDNATEKLKTFYFGKHHLKMCARLCKNK